METKDNLISKTRLVSQKIDPAACKNPSEIVRWMGAIQAQDYAMAKWAIGVRLKDTTDKKVESAIDKGEILRIHLLRPTWHFVSADDIYWMLQLSSPKIKSSLKSRHEQLELTESVIVKTSSIIEKTLSEEIFLTRDELEAEFRKAGIRTDENRLSHILFRAEMDGILCSGPIKKNKLTYALLYERVPVRKELSMDESLAELAKRYFNSRCPATIEDFIWWSNLTVKDVRKAIAMNGSSLHQEIIGSKKFLIPDSFSMPTLEKTTVNLLPAYDEFLISYRDRSSSLSEVNNKRTVSDNGIFYPTIVVNGKVAGLWKRSFQKNKMTVTSAFFNPPNDSTMRKFKRKLSNFGRYLEKETELILKTD